MPPKSKNIPVNTWLSMFSEGIIISRTSVNGSANVKEEGQAHRDDWHLFLLQEEGTTFIEIDFQKYKIKPSSVLYIHPDQVHRLIAFEHATFSSWAINNENLKPEYLKLLEDITPVKPLSLKKETFSIISETASLGIKFSQRKYEKLYHSLLKDSCNTLVAFVVSQYLRKVQSKDTFTRFESITKTFKSALEKDFATVKSPAEFAEILNISTSYLNECVKHTTGLSVSHHIQQRIILEAKRLLYHSDISVKEVAFQLGYDDYSYFIRVFVKNTGMTPLDFRNKNLD